MGTTTRLVLLKKLWSNYLTKHNLGAKIHWPDDISRDSKNSAKKNCLKNQILRKSG